MGKGLNNREIERGKIKREGLDGVKDGQGIKGVWSMRGLRSQQEREKGKAGEGGKERERETPQWIERRQLYFSTTQCQYSVQQSSDIQRPQGAVANFYKENIKNVILIRYKQINTNCDKYSIYNIIE